MSSKTSTPSATLAPSAKKSSLLNLPLHIISNILSHLGTIQELSPVIRSHPIFRDAFNDNFHSVCCSIIRNQIPRRNIFMALILLEVSKTYDETDDNAPSLQICRVLSTDTITMLLPRNIHPSINDYADISRQHSLAKAECSKALELDCYRPQRQIDRAARAYLQFALLITPPGPDLQGDIDISEAIDVMTYFFGTWGSLSTLAFM